MQRRALPRGNCSGKRASLRLLQICYRQIHTTYTFDNQVRARVFISVLQHVVAVAAERSPLSEAQDHNVRHNLYCVADVLEEVIYPENPVIQIYQR